jgi:hypothetical protein
MEGELKQRIETLEDDITEAGITLAGIMEMEDCPERVRTMLKVLMRDLGKHMNIPEVLKRQGI